MVKTGHIFKFYLVLCTLHSAYGLRSFVMDFETIDYEFNTDIVKSMHLKLIDYKGHKAVNATFVAVEDLPEFNLIHWVTVPTARGKENVRTLYNFTINGCQFLEGKLNRFNILALPYLEELKMQFPNMPKRCPVGKDRDYSVEHFYLNEEVFPPFIPLTKFNAFMGLTVGNVYGFKIFGKAHVEAKKAQNSKNNN